jgi:hypothetical protein
MDASVTTVTDKSSGSSRKCPYRHVWTVWTGTNSNRNCNLTLGGVRSDRTHGAAGRPRPSHAIWRYRGRCRSLAQVSGSYRIGRRLIPVGAVAALCCCSFSGSSSQRSLACKIRLCCRNRSSTLRSMLIGFGRRSLQATLTPRCELCHAFGEGRWRRSRLCVVTGH